MERLSGFTPIGVQAGTGTIAGYGPRQLPTRHSLSALDQTVYQVSLSITATWMSAPCTQPPLSGAQVLTHYQAGTNASPATPYKDVVGADSPAGYWRLNEPADPAASNLGSAGAAANAKVYYNAMVGQPGPSSPAYAGFEA
jgi:hypothetical protein